jgi:hypothetical protein
MPWRCTGPPVAALEAHVEPPRGPLARYVLVGTSVQALDSDGVKPRQLEGGLPPTLS